MKLRIVSSTEFVRCLNPRSPEYLQYLDDHISNVKYSWYNMLKPSMLEDGYDQQDLADAEMCIENHDLSKYDDDEFDAYCNYFYSDPKNGFSKNSKAFDEAWLNHIHKNPHHWQHWVLLRDSGEIEPQDIPMKYICEMLCDWHSFSGKDPNSTASAWYKSNKSKMKLSDKTRRIVEKLLVYLVDPILVVE